MVTDNSSDLWKHGILLQTFNAKIFFIFYWEHHLHYMIDSWWNFFRIIGLTKHFHYLKLILNKKLPFDEFHIFDSTRDNLFLEMRTLLNKPSLWSERREIIFISYYSIWIFLNKWYTIWIFNGEEICVFFHSHYSTITFLCWQITYGL